MILAILGAIVTMCPFIPPAHPGLNSHSKEILPKEITSQETQELIDRMYDVAYGEDRGQNKKFLVGLAAPQIGIFKRIILVDLEAGAIRHVPKEDPQDIQVFINPEIVWSSEEKSSWREGCFSTGNVLGVVSRSTSVRVRAYDRNGVQFTKEYTGYTARIFQHEIDHLNGIRFPDRIENDSDLHWVEPEQMIEYREKFDHWPTKCPREKWQKMKSG